MSIVSRSVIESLVEHLSSYEENTTDTNNFDIAMKRIQAELWRHPDNEYFDAHILEQISEEFHNMYTLCDEEVTGLNIHMGSYQIAAEIVEDAIPE